MKATQKKKFFWIGSFQMLNAHFLFLISHFNVVLEITVLKQVPTHIFSFLNISNIAVSQIYWLQENRKSILFQTLLSNLQTQESLREMQSTCFWAFLLKYIHLKGFYFFFCENYLMSMKLLKQILVLLFFPALRKRISLDKIKLIEIL